MLQYTYQFLMEASTRMTITIVPNLSAAQRAAANQLVAAVEAHDHTYREPYLSNQFNFSLTMPSFFLAYRADQLIGLLSLYTDGGAGTMADVFVLVHPECRRQGVATALWQAAKPVLLADGYTEWEFITEQVFLADYPEFLARTGLQADPETEYQMAAAAAQFPMPKQSPGRIRPLRAADVAALVPLYTAAFADQTPAAARNYLMRAIPDDQTLTYVYVLNQQLVGSCAVDISGVSDYFFSLFISADYQNQGLGTDMVRQIMAVRSAAAPKAFTLGVETNNPAALHVYANAGFKKQTEVVYLICPKKNNH